MMTKDVEKTTSILGSIPEIRAICLDVANGYSEHFVEFVKDIREKFPEHIVIVSSQELHSSFPQSELFSYIFL